ncbi:hypothetical protein D3C81_2094030 [compost metagenome]
MHFTECHQGGIDDALRRLKGGDVVVIGDGLATGSADFPGHVLGGVAADVIDQHIGTFGGERQCVGAAQAATGTGDDHGTAFTDSHTVYSCRR